MNYTSLKQSLAEMLQRAIGAQFQETFDEIRFTEPPSGDISFACFELAGWLQKNPAEVARELAEARESTSFKIFERELSTLTEDTGKKFKMEELESYPVSTEKGEETIHRVMIRCVEKTI